MNEILLFFSFCASLGVGWKAYAMWQETVRRRDVEGLAAKAFDDTPPPHRPPPGPDIHMPNMSITHKDGVTTKRVGNIVQTTRY